MTQPRNPTEIAREIRADWKKPYFGAIPYLEAMELMSSWQSGFINDGGDEIAARFLGNATSWRGEVARRVKSELKLVR